MSNANTFESICLIIVVKYVELLMKFMYVARNYFYNIHIYV